MIKRNHATLYPLPMRSNRPPIGYTRSPEITHEQAEFLQRHALLIFSECSNAGMTFAQTLGTIFATGLHYAVELERDKP